MTTFYLSTALTFPTMITCGHICHHWKLMAKEESFLPGPSSKCSLEPSTSNLCSHLWHPSSFILHMSSAAIPSPAWLWNILFLSLSLSSSILSCLYLCTSFLPCLYALPSPPLTSISSTILDLPRTLKKTQWCLITQRSRLNSTPWFLTPVQSHFYQQSSKLISHLPNHAPTTRLMSYSSLHLSLCSYHFSKHECPLSLVHPLSTISHPCLFQKAIPNILSGWFCSLTQDQTQITISPGWGTSLSST